MQQKWYQATEVEVDSLGQSLHFYMETIEVSRLSALAFFLQQARVIIKVNDFIGKIEKKNNDISRARTCLYDSE